MKNKDITEANRKAWNQALEHHRKSRGIDLHENFKKRGFSTLDEIITAKLKEIGLNGKRVAQLCCNNGRELLSAINLGAESGVGFDISDAFIEEGKELQKISGLNCEFVRTDILEIGHEYDGQFDIVLITIGALSWIPDLDAFFKVTARLLKKGGDLLIYETHPFAYMLATATDKEFVPSDPLKIINTYFRTEPWVDESGLDYYGKSQYESTLSYSFTQKLSDIINPIVRSGIAIKELLEYPHDISNLFAEAEKPALAPLCYILWGKKS